MNKESPLSFRIEPALHLRLEQCSQRLRLRKYTLALLAIEAAVEAIEENDYRLVVPIKFEVARIPIEKAGGRTLYNSPHPQLNEGAALRDASAPPVRAKEKQGARCSSKLTARVSP